MEPISYSIIQVTHENPSDAPFKDEWAGWKRLSYHYTREQDLAAHLRWAAEQVERQGTKDLRRTGELQLLSLSVELKTWNETQHEHNPALAAFVLNPGDKIPAGGKEFKSI